MQDLYDADILDIPDINVSGKMGKCPYRVKIFKKLYISCFFYISENLKLYYNKRPGKCAVDSHGQKRTVFPGVNMHTIRI